MFQKKISNDYVKNYVDKRYEEINSDKKLIKSIFKKNKIDLKNKNVLDLAAGPGTFEVIFSEFKPKEITYLDFCNNYVKFAKIKHKEFIKNKLKINYLVGDLMDVKKLKTNSYDFIFCNISLFYVSDEKSFFKEIKRILKKGGQFYFVTTSKRYLNNKTLFTKYFSLSIYLFNTIFQRKFFPTPVQFHSSLKKKWTNAKLNETYFDEDEEGLMHIILKNE